MTDAPIDESAQTINVSPELDALVDAALEIAAEHGWRRTSVREAAERAGIGRVTALRLAPVKLVLLKRLAERTDEQALGALDEDATDPEIPMRDRLFEALMLRFDTLKPHRAGITAVLRELPRDPFTAPRGAAGARNLDGEDHRGRG